MKPKLVLLRGKPTSGKSTAWQTLRKRKELKDWIFIDNSAIKTQFIRFPDNERRDLGKRCLFECLKVVLPTQKNIMIEEMSEYTLRKNINYYLKKYDYQIMTFQFEVNLKDAYKRNVQRAKDNWHPYIRKKVLKDYHAYHEDRFDTNGILVDCNKLGKRAVVNFILKNLN